MSSRGKEPSKLRIKVGSDLVVKIEGAPELVKRAGAAILQEFGPEIVADVRRCGGVEGAMRAGTLQFEF